MNSFKVVVNGDEYDIVMDEATSLDISPQKEKNQFHILKDYKSFNVEIESENDSLKEVSYLINGSKYNIQIKDKFDLLVEKMGLNTASEIKINEIYAPMPGLILDIMVKKGDQIEKDDPLLILEAMKMENVLKAEGEGIVKNILKKKGDAVEKGQLLIEME